MTASNWPFDWKRCPKTVADFAPPPPPAIVGRGRGEPLTSEAVLEARQRATERVIESTREPERPDIDQTDAAGLL